MIVGKVLEWYCICTKCYVNVGQVKSRCMGGRVYLGFVEVAKFVEVAFLIRRQII